MVAPKTFHAEIAMLGVIVGGCYTAVCKLQVSQYGGWGCTMLFHEENRPPDRGTGHLVHLKKGIGLVFERRKENINGERRSAVTLPPHPTQYHGPPRKFDRWDKDSGIHPTDYPLPNQSGGTKGYEVWF